MSVALKRMTGGAASALLVVASFTPMMMTPAYASVTTGPSAASGDTLTSIDAICAAHLASLGGGTLHDNSPVYTVAAEVTGSTAGDPTEVDGSRQIIEGSQFGTGTPVLSGFSINGQPYRIGGSVNMFGNQYASRKDWSASEYDFNADFETVTTFTYNCNVTEHTEITIDGEFIEGALIPGHPVEGHYWNNGTTSDNDDNITPGHGGGGTTGDHGSCQGINNTHPSWGEDFGNCFFVKTGDAVEDSHEPDVQLPDTYEPGPDADRPDLSLLGQTIDQTDTANLQDHESAGPAIYELGSFYNAQVVICISPKKLPGTWQTQNGYTGTNCNTAYFNVAPWGAGSTTSNGTYISVPAI
jgi:hypothetical protein